MFGVPVERERGIEMPDCYKADCAFRINYTSSICNCECNDCGERIGLNTSHVSGEEKKRFREAFQGCPVSFRAEPGGETKIEQKAEERYDPMEYIWKRRKKWAVKFRCNTDGSTICFGYVCPRCMSESDEPLDKCPKCGADLTGG